MVAEVAPVEDDTADDPVAANEAALRALWERFKADGDPATRERLILHYSPLVKYVAGRLGSGLPTTVDHADFVSYGIFGLIDAIEKFDIERAINGLSPEDRQRVRQPSRSTMCFSSPVSRISCPRRPISAPASPARSR